MLQTVLAQVSDVQCEPGLERNEVMSATRHDWPCLTQCNDRTYLVLSEVGVVCVFPIVSKRR